MEETLQSNYNPPQGSNEEEMKTNFLKENNIQESKSGENHSSHYFITNNSASAIVWEKIYDLTTITQSKVSLIVLDPPFGLLNEDWDKYFQFADLEKISNELPKYPEEIIENMAMLLDLKTTCLHCEATVALVNCPCGMHSCCPVHKFNVCTQTSSI